ncbi:MAG: hypothetical protein ACYC2H_13255 [Thermoplasmatota archaeon]
MQTPMNDNDSTGPALVVNLYPDQIDDPDSWRSEDLGAPSVLFRRGQRGWVAHLEKQAVARADTPEALAADVYGEYGVLAVLHSEPLVAV